MKKMRTIQLICLIATALFVVIALFFCAVHIAWITRGSEANAIYHESGQITYLANSKAITVKAPYQSKKFADGEFVKIYYNKNNVEKCYSPQQIYRVFIFSGIALVFMATTIVITIKIDKSDLKKYESIENEESE